jgi:hypothetical protein
MGKHHQQPSGQHQHSSTHKKGSAREFGDSRRKIGLYSPSSSGHPIPPPPPPTRSEADLQKLIGQILLKYGPLGMFVVFALYSLYKHTTATSACSEPTLGMTNLELHGSVSMLTEVVNAYNQTYPPTADCFGVYLQTGNITASRNAPVKLADFPQRPATTRDIKALEGCRKAVQKEIYQKARQKALQIAEDKRRSGGASKSGSDVSEVDIPEQQVVNPPLLDHVRFFSGPAKISAEKKANATIYRQIAKSTCCITDFVLEAGDSPAERRLAIAPGSSCDWSQVDYPSCFSPEGIADKLAELNTKKSPTLSSWFIYEFNRWHGGTACTNVWNLPFALHRGALRFYTPDGEIDEERIAQLEAFSKKVQGRNDVQLSSTLTAFADMLDTCLPPEQETGRQKHDFMDWIYYFFQKKAASDARDELLTSSMPTTSVLKASYQVMRNGIISKKRTEEPAISTAMLRLFLENTRVYWQTAMNSRHGGSMPLAEPEVQCPGLH